MKNKIIIFVVWLLCFTSSKCFSQINSDTLLTGLALPIYQYSPPGIAGFYQSIDTCASIGVNMMAWFDLWSNLEPTLSSYSFINSPINPLKYLDTTNGTKIKSFVYSIKMIETNLKTTPSDLQGVSFGDPQMISRFTKLIDTLSNADPSVKRISHILIGNEVDGYLSAHPSEISGFVSFFQAAVNRIHIKMPTVKVGTIVTYNNVKSNPALFNALKGIGDFICYTYYAEDPIQPPFTMKPPTDVYTDINWMANNTGGKPFAFSEIGYTSSTANNSSNSLQAAFVSNLFDTLKYYKCNHQVEFVSYQSMYDYPAGACGPYGLGQGLPDTISICGFMNNLGLKSWSTGLPKPAWNVFKSKLAEINSYTCSTTGVGDFVKDPHQISISPNPFSAETILHSNKLLKNATLTIYNSNGQNVKEIKNITGQSVIILRDHLSRGFYLLRLTQDAQIIALEELMIMDN